MTDRSNLREVRNPILALPGFRAVMALPPETREALAVLAYDLAADARRRAEEAWRKNKGPMAVYWKAVGAYARHVARALRSSYAEA